jgi:hypothetical protein
VEDSPFDVVVRLAGAHAAMLSGRPVAVALTLLRACDRVIAFEFDLP